jgi:hypothetical protein
VSDKGCDCSCQFLKVRGCGCHAFRMLRVLRQQQWVHKSMHIAARKHNERYLPCPVRVATAVPEQALLGSVPGPAATGRSSTACRSCRHFGNFAGLPLCTYQCSASPASQTCVPTFRSSCTVQCNIPERRTPQLAEELVHCAKQCKHHSGTGST